VIRVTATVGVVVPTRNAVDHVGRALASVLSQEPPPTDVVVVDARSTDGTRDVVHATPGVRLVEQSGVGLGAARNQGIAAVAGDLVAFCDADDRWSPGALAVRMRHLEATPECDAVIGAVVMEPIGRYEVPAQYAERLGVPLPGYTPGALLVRRRTLERVGPFSERLEIGTDSEWFVRLAQSPLRCDLLRQVVLQKAARAASLSTDVAAYRAELLGIARAYIRQRKREEGTSG
jgi:glycosyltransferase involved in cell wall biosynthesis